MYYIWSKIISQLCVYVWFREININIKNMHAFFLDPIYES